MPAVSVAEQTSNGTEASQGQNLDIDRTNLQSAIAWARENDHSAALAAVRPVVKSPDFPELTSEERHAALFLYGSELDDAGNPTEAHEALQKASSMDEANGDDWIERLDSAAKVHDDADCLFSLETIARRWPATLGQINDSYIGGLESSTRNNTALSEVWRTAFLTLADVGWEPSDPALNADDVWIDLIAALLATHQTDRAIAISKHIVEPLSFVEMWSDKRFDPIFQGDPSHFDILKIMAFRLSILRAKAKAAPDDVRVNRALVEEFINQNRPREALELADRMIAKASSFDQTTNAGALDPLSWLLDARARSLILLGRADDAVAMLEKAGLRPEVGGTNVSQNLNLGILYNHLGRPNEALKIIQNVGEMSGFGRMVQEGVKACAYAELHSATELAASLKYLKAHGADSPSEPINSLLCANDRDGAARLLIAELADPAARRKALEYVQSYAPESGLPFLSEVDRRWRAIIARPDVGASINAVGRVGSFPLTHDVF
jgi:tetratricopeptide (TPR) repeat protein